VFERFTDEARQVVTTAGEEAASLGHRNTGTEHLLLGLLRAEARRALPPVLGALGILDRDVRSTVAGVVGEKAIRGGKVRFTSHCIDVLGRAHREADARGDDRITPLPLLLALLADEEGLGTQILARYGGAPAVRRAVDEHAQLQGRAPGSRGSEGAVLEVASDEPGLSVTGDALMETLRGHLYAPSTQARVLRTREVHLEGGPALERVFEPPGGGTVWISVRRHDPGSSGRAAAQLRRHLLHDAFDAEDVSFPLTFERWQTTVTIDGAGHAGTVLTAAGVASLTVVLDGFELDVRCAAEQLAELRLRRLSGDDLRRAIDLGPTRD